MKKSGVNRPFGIQALAFTMSLMSWAVACRGEAATIAPPMLDITRQCDANTRHNVTAMSECVVAESEARADLLQHWDKLADVDVDKCVKLGRKAKRQPYTAMEKCLASAIALSGAPIAVKDENVKGEKK